MLEHSSSTGEALRSAAALKKKERRKEKTRMERKMDERKEGRKIGKKRIRKCK